MLSGITIALIWKASSILHVIECNKGTAGGYRFLCLQSDPCTLTSLANSLHLQCESSKNDGLHKCCSNANYRQAGCTCHARNSACQQLLAEISLALSVIKNAMAGLASKKASNVEDTS